MHINPRICAAALAGTLALAGVATAQGQAPSQEDLTKRYEEKLAKDFVSSGGWVTDYDQARARAKQEGKPLFVYFTRSYAH